MTTKATTDRPETHRVRQGHLTNLRRCAVHTVTTRPWSLAECIVAYEHAGVSGIGVWRDALAATGVSAGARLLKASSLEVVALCRGGFFVSPEPERRALAISDTIRAIEEAAAISSPSVVLVCGAHPRVPAEIAVSYITDAVSECEKAASRHHVRLLIEPLHPMYADQRSAVVTLRQARQLCECMSSPWVGIAVDVYHTWWDPDLRTEISTAGAAGYLGAFHVCDWRQDTNDLLCDRGVMGEGCIDIPRIRSWMVDAGFSGWNEIEIMSNRYWSGDQVSYLDRLVRAYLEYV